MKKIIVAIDGLSGCGKSSTAKAVAKKIAYTYIDTGAMYRSITLYFLENQIDWKNTNAVADALQKIRIDFRFNESTQHNDTYLNDQNIEDQIRSMRISEKVSEISAISAVRRFLVSQQQQIGQGKGIVMDGRDIATVVFPDAELKIFMTAHPEVRAKRRQAELHQKGQKASLEEIMNNFLDRDFQDSHRADSPLRKSEDAIEIDTSDLDFEQQVQSIVDLVRKYQNL